jgi:hypothetical protein
VLHRAALGLLPLALLAVACGTGDGKAASGDAAETAASTTTPPSTLPPCADTHHRVALDVFGFMTLADDDFTQWLEDATDEPLARPGVADLVAAYQALGYEIWYVTTVPSSVKIGDVPFDNALRDWLTRHGFPTGQGTSIYLWDHGDKAVLSITDALLELSAKHISVDAGYTDDQDKGYAMITGGIPAAHMYTLGPGAGTSGTKAIANDDVIPHAHAVAQLPRICAKG